MENPEELNLVYKIGPRYNNTVTMEKIRKARTIADLIPDHSMKSISSYRNIEIAILDKSDGRKALAQEAGADNLLNRDQVELLNSMDYSSQIRIKANFTKSDEVTGVLKDRHFVYSMTVIPKHEAEYKEGMDVLIEYLRKNSRQQASMINRDLLKPGRVRFTVTKKGNIKNATLNATSGYPLVDQLLIKLINEIPGSWQPASNWKGEYVDQELIFFFGMQGC